MKPSFETFYPVLPDLDWIEKLAPSGMKVVQLRLKDAGVEEIERQIAGALEVCRAHHIQLIVNDYWEAAIRLGADYIHLGQEDLATADIARIKQSGMKLGISTHSLEELEIALAAEPDYVALGPVYETILKKMKWQPQGLEKVSRWRVVLDSDPKTAHLPLIAIGGITPERAPGVLAAGADSTAVVTDLIMADDPLERARHWVQVCSG